MSYIICANQSELDAAQSPYADIEIAFALDADATIRVARNVRVVTCRDLRADNATIGGSLRADGAKISGNLSATDAKISGVTIAEPTQAEIDFLRRIPIDRLVMSEWHGKDWCADKPGDCGTTHCLAGFAQAWSEDQEIRKMEPSAAGRKLIPNLSYLFFAPQALVEKVIRQYQEVP